MPALGTLLRYVSLIGIVAGIVLAGLCKAQEPVRATDPAFEVASVRPVEQKSHTQFSGGNSITFGTPRWGCRYSADRVSCQATLSELIEEAYQVKRFELDAPKWIADDLFAIQATMPLNTKIEIARLMLQRALADRFGLIIHRESREITVYGLVPGKYGVKLQVADHPDHRKLKNVDTPVGSMSSTSFSSPGEFFEASITLDALAESILPSHVDLDLPVVNMTGLAGEYRFDMHWTPAEQTRPVKTLQDPAFLRALESQYGLHLKKCKARYDVLVVDHVDRMPTEN